MRQIFLGLWLVMAGLSFPLSTSFAQTCNYGTCAGGQQGCCGANGTYDCCLNGCNMYDKSKAAQEEFIQQCSNFCTPSSVGGYTSDPYAISSCCFLYGAQLEGKINVPALDAAANWINAECSCTDEAMGALFPKFCFASPNNPNSCANPLFFENYVGGPCLPACLSNTPSTNPLYKQGYYAQMCCPYAGTHGKSADPAYIEACTPYCYQSEVFNAFPKACALQCSDEGVFESNGSVCGPKVCGGDTATNPLYLKNPSICAPYCTTANFFATHVKECCSWSKADCASQCGDASTFNGLSASDKAICCANTDVLSANKTACCAADPALCTAKTTEVKSSDAQTATPKKAVTPPKAVTVQKGDTKKR